MFTVWLTFEENDEKLLQNLINNFGKIYESPVFKPHITIFGPIDIKLNILDDLIKQISQRIHFFNVDILGISYSKYIWKTLYVDLKNNLNLITIFNFFKNQIEPTTKNNFSPHISLIYKKIDLKEKKRIINNLKLKNSLKVDKICIQQHSDKVSDWKIVANYNLSK